MENLISIYFFLTITTDLYKQKETESVAAHIVL